MFASGGSKVDCLGNIRQGLTRLRASSVVPCLVALISLVLLPSFADSREPSDSESEQVIERYLNATGAENQTRAASMEVSIDASIPKLKKEGKLHALRKISELGKITYKILGFQGDDTIKTEVIARYLDAEQKGQDNQKFAIAPQNYKFKFKGLHRLQNGQRIYVLFLTPRRKEIGLFKGEMWLDANTCLPVMETGKLVKSPSVFFKKVEFYRDYRIENGVAVPQHMLSTIDARLVGKVTLTINYSGYQRGTPVGSSGIAGTNDAAPVPPPAVK
ncbi:MAG: hypothetical protein WAM39_03255 [Bryobacteraceae bacterium]